MNDVIYTPNKMDDMARTYPTGTVLAAIGTGIVLGVLARLFYDRNTEPTTIEAAMDSLRGAGDRMRGLFR